MIVKVNNYNMIMGSAIAITLYPFIFVQKRYADDKVTINHEKIHLAQQKELFIIGFYLWYLYEQITKGYEKNRFEVEAYKNEKNLDYLTTRKKYNYIS